MIYELMLRREEAVELLLSFPFRFVSRIRETWVVIVFILISLSFLFVGLLALASLYLKNMNILDFALGLATFTYIVTLFFVSILPIYGLIIKEDEIRKIIEYFS